MSTAVVLGVRPYRFVDAHCGYTRIYRLNLLRKKYTALLSVDAGGVIKTSVPVLWRIFGPRRDEVTGEWRRLHNEELGSVRPQSDCLDTTSHRRRYSNLSVSRSSKITYSKTRSDDMRCVILTYLLTYLITYSIVQIPS